MDIKYLTMLKDNPEDSPNNSEHSDTIIGISLDEINQLELKYNKGLPFPKAIKELLFLAGEYCYVFDYGLTETQEEMQEDARSWLVNHNREITRPFFVVDIYNAGTQFLFVYLDSHIDNPTLYEAELPHRNYYPRPWLHSLEKSLSEFIDFRIKKVKSGYNPF